MNDRGALRPGFIAVFALAGTLIVGLPCEAVATTQGLAGTAVTLREAEHKTSKHPSKKYYVNIWPDGPQVSFLNTSGNFASYTFPTEAFPLNQPCALLSPGSPNLLPLRVTRVGPNDYRIEWLEAPPSAETLKVVKSY